jgi:hypothetical protein
MKLIVIVTMMTLSACSTNPTSDFCLLYTKPTIENPHNARILVEQEKSFTNAVNVNKGTYKRLCE